MKQLNDINLKQLRKSRGFTQEQLGIIAGMTKSQVSRMERGKPDKGIPAQRDTVIIREKYRYEGQWPEGKGVLCSYKYGLVFGTFKEGTPEGICVNYGPNERIYWGPMFNGKTTGFRRKSSRLVRNFQR